MNMHKIKQTITTFILYLFKANISSPDEICKYCGKTLTRKEKHSKFECNSWYFECNCWYFLSWKGRKKSVPIVNRRL